MNFSKIEKNVCLFINVMDLYKTIHKFLIFEMLEYLEKIN